jgi:hypothetical protein
MFSWIKDRRNRATEAHFIESVPRVLAEYGKLLEKFPAAYIDEAWLPLKKLGMKRALKIGWKLAKDDEQREWIKIGWTLLSQFQKGVGSKPIDSNIITRENLARLDRFLELAKIAQLEADSDQIELLEFVQQNSPAKQNK